MCPTPDAAPATNGHAKGAKGTSNGSDSCLSYPSSQAIVVVPSVLAEILMLTLKFLSLSLSSPRFHGHSCKPSPGGGPGARGGRPRRARGRGARAAAGRRGQI